MKDEETVIMDFSDLPSREEYTKAQPRVVKGVVEYTLNGEYVASYDSVTEAAKKHSISRDVVYNCCRGTIFIPKNTESIFLYRGDDIEKRLSLMDERANKGWKTGLPRRVNEYALNGRFLFQYPDMKTAAKANNVSTQVISNCCKGKRLFLGKSIFLFAADNIKDRVPTVKHQLYLDSLKRTKCRPVDEYTIDGQYVKGYASASLAARECNIHVSQIVRCCQGQDGRGRNYFQVHGKIFLYAGNSISERLVFIQDSKTNQTDR